MAGQQPLLRKRKGQGGDVCDTAAKIPLCPTVPDPQKGTCDTPQHALSYRVNGALSLCQFCRAKNTSPARTTTPPTTGRDNHTEVTVSPTPCHALRYRQPLRLLSLCQR